MPLGLLADVSYDQLVIKPQPGDLIVLYSDGVSEATNPAGKLVGSDWTIRDVYLQRFAVTALPRQ